MHKLHPELAEMVISCKVIGQLLTVGHSDLVILAFMWT